LNAVPRIVLDNGSAKEAKARGFMFTGLIEEVGTVVEIPTVARGTQLQIAAPQVAEKIQIGDSIAVNGCCLTVAAHQGSQVIFDLLEETLERTNFGTLRQESRVNLERALAADARLGGHFVQGHVDCAARIVALEQNKADQRLEVELPSEFAHYVAYKGSIAVNGISLTVSEVSPESFAVWIIPHTRAHTNMGTVRAGDRVNLEFDLIAKYLERMLDRNAVRTQRLPL
jgi:riboflavin synthase